jgi:hypothetical protein
VNLLQFSNEERNLAFRAMDEAEEHTSRYYCIPPHRWHRMPYDMLTREDHGWEPLPEEILARVQCLETLKTGAINPCEFYRIQLNDPSILHAAERENLFDDLYPFLVYILTHEMVHLVRLSTILEQSRDRISPDSEEARVQKISRQILSAAGHRRFEPVLQKFCAPQLTLHVNSH